MTLQQLQESRTKTFLLALCLIVIIATIDWRLEIYAYFGVLYILPMLLLGTILARWQIVTAAIVCTVLSNLVETFMFSVEMDIPRDVLAVFTLAASGLFASEVTRSYHRERENRAKLSEEVIARRAAEEQLAFLIQSSPAGILTMRETGEILLANQAAQRLFSDENHPLPGKNIARYIPALGSVPSINETEQGFRAEMQCRGERESGEVFLANVYFSTYRTAQGPRLAALVMDASEHLRDREEASLEQMLAGSRILVGAVSHEVRNVCGAIGVIYENLSRGQALAGNQDFEALGSLVQALAKIASLELKQSTARIPVLPVNVHDVLTDLRIVLEPTCKDADITLRWDVPRELPLVWADRHSLMQALLNLTKNSQRAVEQAATRTIAISAARHREKLSIRVTDSGPGVASPKNLFQPLQKGADANGLGLYLSRAFVRSFRGELRYDPSPAGCSFVIDLMLASDEERTTVKEYGTHPASVA